jgi:hypothetical protein
MSSDSQLADCVMVGNLEITLVIDGDRRTSSQVRHGELVSVPVEAHDGPVNLEVQYHDPGKQNCAVRVVLAGAKIIR